MEEEREVKRGVEEREGETGGSLTLYAHVK